MKVRDDPMCSYCNDVVDYNNIILTQTVRDNTENRVMSLDIALETRINILI